MTGDGRSDLVTNVRYASEPVIAVIPQQPDGTLGTRQTHETDGAFSDPYGIATGDLNGDGLNDVAVGTSQGLNLFYQAAGSLGQRKLLETSLPPLVVEMGDQEGDGDLDIVAYATQGNGSGDVYLFANWGPVVGFVQSTVLEGVDLWRMDVGDLNGDGRLDIASHSWSTLRIFIQQVDGGYVQQEYAEDYTHDVDIADLNGDGRDDVLTASGDYPPASRVRVYRQQAGGALGAPSLYDVEALPVAVQSADVNGDGSGDIAVQFSSGHFRILPQRPDGTFGPGAYYDMGWSGGGHDAEGLAAGDVTGDGMADVAYPESSGIKFLRQGLAATLELSSSKKKIQYGGEVVLTATLGTAADAANDVVSIYAEPDGEPRFLVASGPVDSTGTFSVSVSPGRNTAYTAEWQADPEYVQPEAAAIDVKVQVVATGELKKFYGRSGSYKLYHAGVDPRYVAKVKPNHAGDSVGIQLEVQIKKKWKEIGSELFKLNPKSRVTIVLVDPAKGYRFRIRTLYDSDDDHVPDISPWYKFKVTK